MDASTKARALRAVAKVVMSVSWCGGCGGALSATTAPDDGGFDAVTRWADAQPTGQYGEAGPADAVVGPATEDGTLADAVTASPADAVAASPADAVAASPADAVAVPVEDAPDEPLADAALPDGPLACAITKDSDGGLTGPAIECCLALTASFVPDAASSVRIDAGAWKADASLSACCEGLAAGGSLAGFTYGTLYHWPLAACMACADAIGQDEVSACIPWGPPVPPAMPEALEALS
jgi:hypothetical protein